MQYLKKQDYHHPSGGKRLRNIFLMFLIVILLVILWLTYTKINVLPMRDFIEYWASGRINITGGNPYDATQMLVMEKSVGWQDSEAVMMFNPPWALPYAMLFGVMDYQFSRFLCFLIQLVILCFCSVQLWGMFNGEKRKAWIGLLVILTFAPSLHLLKAGQITVLVLLGTVGFVSFLNKKMDFWAGAFASLVLIKPHLLYLFVFAVVIWSLSQHRLRTIYGMASSFFILTTISLIINPRVITQYINVLQLNPMDTWMTATLGGYLRSVLGADKSFLQYLPSLIGFIWFIAFWVKHHQNFNWITHLPLLIMVSYTMTAYGWIFDAPIIVWGLIQVVILFDVHHWTFIKSLIFLFYWLSNLFIVFANLSQDRLWWFPSVMLFLYLFSMYYLTRIQAGFTSSLTAETAEQ